MIQIRWHGRGGQGAKTASQLLAEAAVLDGKFTQAFPEYGAERTGAPIKAYTKISDERILAHTPIVLPDIVVVVDETLLDVEPITEGFKDSSILLVNTADSPQEIRKLLKLDKGKIFTIDATKIAIETIGIPIPNTAMLGALMGVADLVNIETLKTLVIKKFKDKLSQKALDGNLAAIERAYKEVVGE